MGLQHVCSTLCSRGMWQDVFSPRQRHILSDMENNCDRLLTFINARCSRAFMMTGGMAVEEEEVVSLSHHQRADSSEPAAHGSNHRKY